MSPNASNTNSTGKTPIDLKQILLVSVRGFQVCNTQAVRNTNMRIMQFKYWELLLGLINNVLINKQLHNVKKPNKLPEAF